MHAGTRTQTHVPLGKKPFLIPHAKSFLIFMQKNTTDDHLHFSRDEENNTNSNDTKNVAASMDLRKERLNH